MKAGENEYGIRQNAYQIWVYDEQGTCVWDSKKIADDRSLNIEYAGTPLLPETRYTWKLRAWTQKGETLSASSWFETGIMGKMMPMSIGKEPNGLAEETRTWCFTHTICPYSS